MRDWCALTLKGRANDATTAPGIDDAHQIVLWLTMDLSKLPTVSAESGNDVIDSTPIKLDRLDPSVDQIVPTRR